jgi:hypothetical protein
VRRWAARPTSAGVAFPKVAQAGRYSHIKLKPIDTPEDALQNFTNEYLTLRHVEYIRVPETNSLIVMRAALAGKADNTCTIPISDRYSLCLQLELKTKSQLHGKQVRNSVTQSWVIAQTPEQVQAIVERFIADADKIRKLLAESGCV